MHPIRRVTGREGDANARHINNDMAWFMLRLPRLSLDGLLTRFQVEAEAMHCTALLLAGHCYSACLGTVCCVIFWSNRHRLRFHSKCTSLLNLHAII
jgi:hypothetical protein